MGVEIKVLKSIGTEKPYRELIPLFEKISGHRVPTRYGGTVHVRNWLSTGEPFDLVIAASDVIDSFSAFGVIIPGSRLDIATSGVGIAVGPGVAKPDISTPETFKSALLAAKSIGYSTGPSGDYFLKVIDRIGLTEAIKSKLKQIPAGGMVGSLVANGDAEIGIQQVCELKTFPGVDYVGALPDELQNTTIFSGGIAAAAKEANAARELADFLASPESVATFRKFGLEPPRG